MAGFRRTSIGRKMRRPVGMTIRVAIEAGHAPAQLLRTAILGLVELLLRKRRHQKAQALELLRIDDAVEQLIIILDGDELPLRDVTEVRTLIEIYRRREPGQKVIGNVEIDVEAREVAPLLALDLVDLEAREHHAAFLMLGVRQREEAQRE